MSQNKPGKIVVVGCGGHMGQPYIKALLELGFSNTVIGVDIDSERLRTVAEKYPNFLYTKDLQEALRLNPEIAVVVVNSVAHLRVIEQCYQAGIRKFFVEKPLVYDEEELTKLERLDLENLYTAFLINFSGVVSSLCQFMKERNLMVIEARSVWGKNRCAVADRPIGGDAEEEMPHSLALAISIVSFNQIIVDIDCFAKLSSIPYVQPQLLELAKSLGYGFPEVMNDSTTAYFSIKTKDRIVPVHLQSSFNMFEQRRWVEFDLIQRGKFGLPEFKACLEFDVGNKKDRLRIKNALTDKKIISQEFFGNKLEAQLLAALKAFSGEAADPRLVDFNNSAWLVRLTQKVVQSGT